MGQVSSTISLDDVPLSRFHYRATAFITGGLFCDGYILGIVSVALAVYGPQQGLSDTWLGLLGAGALIGLFAGSLAFGPIIDRLGRQRMYVIDLCIFLVASLLQLVFVEPWQVLTLRVVLGVAMGIDYAIGATLLSEFLPRRHRGTFLASLNALWTVGFVVAFVVGYALRGSGPDSWKWMLASGAVPAALVLLMRLGAPESPRWLAATGRADQARAVLDKHFGPHVVLEDPHETPAPMTDAAHDAVGMSQLFTKKWRTRAAFASLFWFCQVLPFFALFTFAPTVLNHTGLSDGFTGGLVLNVFQLVGAVVGVVVMDRLSRRGFTIWSFAIMAVALLPLGLMGSPPAFLVVGCFAIYAFTISCAGNLCHVYPAEIFSTRFRATGVGFAAAMSRIGAAAGTFLLPVSMSRLGTPTTMLLAVGVLVIGVVSAVAWAPETRMLRLEDASDPTAAAAS